MISTDVQTGYPSIDKPWLKYYTAEDLAIQSSKTIYQNTYDNNKAFINDIAILYYGNRIRYRDLFSHVEQCARALRQAGVQSGDCITLCTASVPEAIYLVLACSRIGVIANFLNPLFSKEQIIDRINETESKWLFVLDAMYSYIQAALPETCIDKVVVIPATNSIPVFLSKILYFRSEARKIMKQRSDRISFLKWKDFCGFNAKYLGTPDVSYKPDTPTVMVYSSGSTGASKGILLTNDGINATISHYQTHSYVSARGDTFLQMIPIWFSTGIVLSILMPLVKGITVIPEPKFGKDSFVKDLAKYRPTMTLTATSLWLYAINDSRLEKTSFSNMKYPITGGEKVLPQDEQRMNDFLRNHHCKTKMYKGYGMCELGGTVTASSNDGNYSDKGMGTGIPLLHAVVSAFDISTGKELKYGQHGEIRVFSPARMKGYYKNPQATSEFFKSDERGVIWGCTGDIGYVDEDGEVFILGRATDHYRRENGEIVYLFDIEAEILADEAVAQCKVVDIVTEAGKKLAAHVVFRPGTGDETGALSRIHSRLTQSLPGYMAPDFYKVRSSMPVHTNGKMDIRTLRMDREELIPAEHLR